MSGDVSKFVIAPPVDAALASIDLRKRAIMAQLAYQGYASHVSEDDAAFFAVRRFHVHYEKTTTMVFFSCKTIGNRNDAFHEQTYVLSVHQLLESWKTSGLSPRVTRAVAHAWFGAACAIELAASEMSPLRELMTSFFPHRIVHVEPYPDGSGLLRLPAIATKQ